MINGERLTVGGMKLGMVFANMFLDNTLYYVRGEYNFKIKRYYCKAYYRSSNIRLESKDKKWPSNKRVLTFKLK